MITWFQSYFCWGLNCWHLSLFTIKAQFTREDDIQESTEGLTYPWRSHPQGRGMGVLAFKNNNKTDKCSSMWSPGWYGLSFRMLHVLELTTNTVSLLTSENPRHTFCLFVNSVRYLNVGWWRKNSLYIKYAKWNRLVITWIIGLNIVFANFN